MKNNIKKSWQYCFKLSFWLLLFIPVTSGIASNVTPIPAKTELTCPTPNVSKTGQGSGSISFAWGPVSGAASYNAWYVRKADNYSSGVTNTTSNSVTFSSLPAGEYLFYFTTICSNGVSDAIIIDETVYFN